MQTAATSFTCNNGCTKRPENKPGNFKTLQAKGDADNGKTQQQATDQITQSRNKSAENKPDQVSYCIHSC